MFVPLPDGESFFVWRNADRTKEELARLHPRDADDYDRWCAFWDEAVALLRPVFDDPKAIERRAVPARQRREDSIYQLAVAGSAAETRRALLRAPGDPGRVRVAGDRRDVGERPRSRARRG